MVAVSVTGFQVGQGDAVVDLWNHCLPSDPITMERFRNLILLDPNFDSEGLRLAWQADRVVGAVYAVRRLTAMVGDDLEPEKGWILFFFVAPDVRRQGIAAKLLGSAMEWLRSKGRTEVHFSPYTPNYILPGLDRDRYPEAAQLLVARGFATLYEAAAMDRGIVDYETPAEIRKRHGALERDGFTFGTPSTDELVPLIRLAHDEFNPDWGRAIREAVAAGLSRENIVVARDPAQEIIGWAMFGTYEKVLERFGPFGVLTTQRGLGLGAVLLHLTLTRMRAYGAHSAWFLWTGEESPAGHLYRRTGFTTTRRFDVMRAALE